MGLWIQGLKHDLHSWVSNTTCIHGSQTQPVFMGLKHNLYSWVSNTTCIHGSQTRPVFMGLKHNLYSWVSNTTCIHGSLDPGPQTRPAGQGVRRDHSHAETTTRCGCEQPPVWPL